MKHWLPKALLAGLLIGSLSACNKNSGSNDSSKTAQVAVYLTDGPAQYESVYLDVQKVEIHTEQGWQPLALARPGRYDLLRFRNGTDTLLGRVVLPVGRVSEMRLVLGDDNHVVADGQMYPLKTPSAQTSGYKMKLATDLEAGRVYDIWLDFDAGKSIVQTGNGQYLLKLVTRAYTVLTDGRIRGTVTPASAAPVVLAVHDADTFSALPNPDGFFMIGGLPEGSYQLWVQPGNGNYQSQYYPQVLVSPGSYTDLGTIQLQP